jgi:Protein of unknown function (DUF4007)
MKTSFSGHEKFECKISWLPLAYKDIQAIYNDIEMSIATTGLGSNKIKSLKQWLNKFTLLDNKKVDAHEFSKNAEIIFSNDPYLEKIESLWILHIYLSQNFEKATLYSLFFNEFFFSSFTKESLSDRTQKWCEEKSVKISQNTLDSDINVLIRMYLKNDSEKEFSSGLFCELNLLHKVDNGFIFNIKNPKELSDTTFLYIFLYFIRKHDEMTISVKDLQFGKTSLQYTLGLTEDRLLEKLEKLSDLSNGQIVYQEAAGIKEIYLHNRPSLEEALIHVYK